jgi:hypothetical protein
VSQSSATGSGVNCPNMGAAGSSATSVTGMAG